MGRWAILNGVLVVIVLLLGLQIFRTWGRTLPTVEVATRQGEPAPKPDGKGDGKAGGTRRGGKRGAAERTEQPAILVATIVNKDLFDPSRQKPTEEVKAAPVKEVGPPPNLTLVGVRMIGRDHEVLVTDAAQANQQRRLRIGDQVGGYTLKTVDPSRVTMTSNSGETITLTLAVDKSGGGGAVGAVPRPPGVPQPGRPGQPPGIAPSPAAGVQPAHPAGVAPPAVGAQPRPPRAAIQGARVPPVAPQVPGAAAGAGIVNPAPVPPAFANPNLPAAVREKLEQLKSN